MFIFAVVKTKQEYYARDLPLLWNRHHDVSARPSLGPWDACLSKNPPHFHVRYNEYRATIDIQTGEVTGQMPRRALHLVFDWLDLHKEELMHELACSAERENHRPQGNTLKWVTAARVVGDYLLELDFNDGRRVVFDCQPLINQYKLFAPLRDKDVFARFALDGWTVTWLDGTVDIAPEHLYELGKAA